MWLRMDGRTEQQKRELIEAVALLASQRLPKAQVEPAIGFLSQFYTNVAADDLIERGADHLYGAALSMWQLASTRKPGKTRIRVFTPRIDQDGWVAGHTAIAIIHDDMPFLVDSVTQELDRRAFGIHMVVHPVLAVLRAADGTAQGLVEPGTAGAVRESFMYFEIDEIPSDEVLDELKAALEGVLTDVRHAVSDWAAMRARAADLMTGLTDVPPNGVAATEVNEARDFLRWVTDNHFTFLGARLVEYRREGDDIIPTVVPGKGLGVLRDDGFLVFNGQRSAASASADVRDFMSAPTLLEITKANRRATVHRAVHLDVIGVKLFDAAGQAAGEAMFVGLFTSSAYNQSVRLIPYLRTKVEAIQQRAGFPDNGHAAKALAHILDTYPRDELFQISVDDLFRIALGVLRLQDRKRVALFVRRDVYGRFLSCLVYVPRDRLDLRLREKLGAVLAKGFAGRVAAYTMTLEEGVLARIHYIIATAPGTELADEGAVEASLIEAARSWADKLQTALVEAKGEAKALRLVARYGAAFSEGYQELHSADAAVFDIDRIEETLASGRLGVNLYRPLEAADHELRFKIYNPGGPVQLADVMPVLDNTGLKVNSVMPHDVGLPDGTIVWIHDFTMSTPDRSPVDLKLVRLPFHHAFLKVWEGAMENDGFNRLVIGAGLDWRAVVILRSYARYLQQARLPYSQGLVMDTLSQNPQAAKLIVDLFDALLNPDRDPGESERLAIALQADFDTLLDSVTNLDADTILRRFNNLVRCSLRTNFWQQASDGGPKPYLSIKLDSRNITDLPQPRPLCEIFVYSPRVEAVHLRGGRVARGGLRWSDRREDFRTEILGLVKAQMVKNAVIVPVGSKGGFVVKRPPAPSEGREAFLQEGIACYKIFMSGLLDITDNLLEGRIVPRDRVKRRDGDDPYLVVAADKGTATFSDIANSVSEAYGHWLGDAFASGGSVGYDHKKMGITARGAWEGVKRHFREIGKNIQREDFTVVGVGDMAGDVFGNGMLQSPHIRLLAAFNHAHIFIDPNPDSARTAPERARLFALPRSSWADYDRSLMSPGGMIYERSAKTCTLTPEIKALLGTKADKLAPTDMIRLILKLDVELLWFGGIGTYVKQSDETHADVGDKSNDALRVDARDVKAKVVGEGANLGMTQLARVQYAQGGGRLNTDFIDNSAGVDCSDHEVNIKILLGDVETRGDMTRKQRNALLETMTDEVGLLVLRDNYLQTQAISVAEARGVERFDDHVRLMRELEKTGLLNRALEYLPDDEEIEARRSRRKGLTRPELAVLLAYSKMWLYDALLGTSLPDDPKLIDDLVAYFPVALQTPYRTRIEGHQLRREIIATVVTNSLVNRAGPTFVLRLMDTTGMAVDDIARSYIVAREAFRLRDMWRAIEALDNQVPAQVQTDMLLTTKALMERTVAWLLANARHPLALGDEVEGFRPGIDALRGNLAEILSDAGRASLDNRRTKLLDKGVPTDLAQTIASLPILAASPDVVNIARRGGQPVETVARVYFAVGDRFGINWLRGAAMSIDGGNHWEKQAVAALVDDLFSQQSALTQRVLDDMASRPADSRDPVAVWGEARQRSVDRLQVLLGELRAQGDSLDLAMLAVGARALRGLGLSGG